ncbi:MAG: hypothetical protein QOE16_900, partial [Microbacteriaceae bacterium]|nr:hypothetical protein [Microbacteriaceae bacterium]
RAQHLTFRGFPGKTIRQPFFHPWGDVPHGAEEWRSDRPDVWYVLEDGSNLDEVVTNALATVCEQAMPFIDEHDDPARAMHSLRTAYGCNTDFGSMGVLAAGIGSPHNLQLIERLGALLDEDRRTPR